jgi:hypothetical protein
LALAAQRPDVSSTASEAPWGFAFGMRKVYF